MIQLKTENRTERAVNAQYVLDNIGDVRSQMVLQILSGLTGMNPQDCLNEIAKLARERK